MINRFIALFIFFLFGLTMACTNSEPPLPTPIPLTSYQSDNLGFAVQYPATWHIRETGDGLIELRSDLSAVLDASYNGGSIVQIMSLPQLFTVNQEPLDLLNTFSGEILSLIRSEDASSAVLSDPRATVINGQPAAGMLLSARQGTIQTYAEVYVISDQGNTALLMLVYPQNESIRYRDSLDLIVNRFQLLTE